MKRGELIKLLVKSVLDNDLIWKRVCTETKVSLLYIFHTYYGFDSSSAEIKLTLKDLSQDNFNRPFQYFFEDIMLIKCDRELKYVWDSIYFEADEIREENPSISEIKLIGKLTKYMEDHLPKKR